MGIETISSDEFQRDVEHVAGLLRSHGFQRAPKLESETPTTVSVVYTGQNIAFTFYLDIRDQGIDLIVTRYQNGNLVPTWDGGYSSSLFMHLLNHCGFRGRPVIAGPYSPLESRSTRMLLALVNLLTQPCAASLLADQADALPR